MRRMLLVVACTLVPLLVRTVEATVAGPPDPLNPKTYTSCSTRYELHINPSNPQGAGSSAASMKVDGKIAWTKNLDFTLWNAFVRDDGQTIGYAYSWGEDGWGYRVEDLPKENVLWIVRLDADGNVITRDMRPRADNESFICAPTYVPRVSDLSVHEDVDTFVIRTIGQGRGGPEDWWVYRLSTGERIRDAQVVEPPRKDPWFTMIYYARPVPGVPAMLALWDVSPYKPEGTSGDARLALIDFHGREVWAKDLPGENATGANHDRRSINAREASFQFTSAATGKTFRCYLSLDANGDVSPNVVEQDVATLALLMPPAVPRSEPPALVEVVGSKTAKTIELPVVGTISLADPSVPPSVFGEIFDFSIDDRGRLGWVRRAGDKLHFTLVDQTGAVIFDRELPDSTNSRLRQAVWCHGDRWVLFDSGIGGTAAAWWYDAATGELTHIAGLAVGGLRCVAPLPDGGFVGQAGTDWVMSNAIKAFDPSGHVRWSVDLVSPQDVTVTTKGEIAALDGISDQLRYFDAQGKDLRTLELKAVLGKEPNYVTGLDRSIDGGLILHDFNGNPPIYRIDATGAVCSTCDPKYPDGRVFRIAGHVQAAPDGSLWTSDGVAFLKLNEDGTVAHVLGAKPADRSLEAVTGLAIGPDGRIYAVNGKNGALHVFEATGKPVATYHPQPTDFPLTGYSASVLIAHDGSIYYNTGDTYSPGAKPGYLHLASDGARIGWEPRRLDDVTEEWLAQPASSNTWALGYASIALIDESGKVLRTIDRRPNGDWMGNVNDGSVALDGSLAVIAGPSNMGVRGPAVVCIYSAAGDPVTQFELPIDTTMVRIAYAKPFIAMCSPEGLDLFDTREPGVRHRVKLPGTDPGSEGYWYVNSSPDGSEIWLREAASLEIVRLQLPEP